MKTPNTAAAERMTDAEHIDECDGGLQPEMARILGAAIAEADANPVAVTCHYVSHPPQEKSVFTPMRSACGIDGLQVNTRAGSSTESSVTCEACLKELAARHARLDKRTLQRLRNAAVYIRNVDGRSRNRLVAAGLAVVTTGDWVRITDAGRAALAPKAKKTAGPKLTPAQQKRVRELVEDENHSRASAIADVLAYGTESKGAA